MKTSFLIVVLVIGVADFLYTSQIRLASVALLYAILQLQADAAAARFARAGFRVGSVERPEPGVEGSSLGAERGDAGDGPGHASEENIRVEPLRGRKMPRYETYERPAGGDRTAPRTLPPPAVAKSKTRAKKAPGASPFLRIPNFRGASHEVLGVRENSATRTILRAFRHWIKKYHPDHRGEGASGDHARLLSHAKERLLEKRKQSRRAA